MRNRGMPIDAVIPVLVYESVSDAVQWLTRTFGFTLRWQVGEHRAQLGVGTGAIALMQGRGVVSSEHVMVRVENVTAHREAVMAAGVKAGALNEFPYGERQYSALDFAGKTWVFTQSIADVAPEAWGASTAKEPSEI